MFGPHFARLSDCYHLVAPDYPGFGHNDWPDRKKFAYTFDHFVEIMNPFTEALQLSRYTLYMQDYGGPVGFRLALLHSDRVAALILQDAVAHNEVLRANWNPRRAFWLIALPTKARFVQITCRYRPRGLDMLGTIPTRRSTYSTRDTSRSIPQRIRLRSSSGASWSKGSGEAMGLGLDIR